MGTSVDNFHAFYYETISGRYVPKALFIDSDPSVIASLRKSSLGPIIHSYFMMNSQQDCNNTLFCEKNLLQV